MEKVFLILLAVGVLFIVGCCPCKTRMSAEGDNMLALWPADWIPHFTPLEGPQGPKEPEMA